MSFVSPTSPPDRLDPLNDPSFQPSGHKGAPANEGGSSLESMDETGGGVTATLLSYGVYGAIKAYDFFSGWGQTESHNGTPAGPGQTDSSPKKGPIQPKQTDKPYQAPVYSMRSYDMSKPDDIFECFEKDPAKVCIELLDLFKKDPKFAGDIISQIIVEAKYSFKYHPKKNDGSRLGLVGKIDDAIFGIMASAELRYFICRIHLLGEVGVLSGEEASAISQSKEDWEKRKKKTPEMVSIRELLRERTETNKDIAKIWNVCFSFFLSKFGDLTDALRLSNGDIYADNSIGHNEPTITFGHFIERLIYTYGFQILSGKERRIGLVEGTRRVLRHLRGETNRDGASLVDQFPQLSEILKKMTSILEDDSSRSCVIDLIGRIVGNYSSPKRKARRLS